MRSTGNECALNTAQMLSFGKCPPHQPLDAVNCSIQLQGIVPHSSGIVDESVTSSFSDTLEPPIATSLVHSPKPAEGHSQQISEEYLVAVPATHQSNIEPIAQLHSPSERPETQVPIPPCELLEPDTSRPVLEQQSSAPVLNEQQTPVLVPELAHSSSLNEIPSQVASGSEAMFPCPFCPRCFPSKNRSRKP